MDEPLSNLDAQLRPEMRREIRALQRRLGITMVYVTHDQIEAMSMADQVVLLRDGRIEQDGAAGRALRAAGHDLRRALHRHAADEPAAAPRRDGCIMPDAARARSCRARRRRDRTLAVGVRPESRRVSSARACPRRVASVEYLGADTLSLPGRRRAASAFASPAAPAAQRRRDGASRLGRRRRASGSTLTSERRID